MPELAEALDAAFFVLRLSSVLELIARAELKLRSIDKEQLRNLTHLSLSSGVPLPRGTDGGTIAHFLRPM